MFHTTLASLANPGTYDESAVATASMIPMLITAFLTLALVITGGALSGSKFARKSWTRKTFIILIGAGFVCLIATGVASLVVSSNSDKAYAASVADWLDADYGIEVSNEIAQDLIGDSNGDKETVVVEYVGKNQAIVLLNTADGHVSVVDPNSAVLETID